MSDLGLESGEDTIGAMFELEDVETLEQFDRAMEIRNPFYWMMPSPGFQQKAFTAELNDDVRRRIVLVKLDGEDVGYMRVIQAFWSSSPGLFSGAIAYRLDHRRESLARQLITVFEEIGRELDAETMTLWVHSDHPEQAAALEAAGYQAGQMNPITACKLDEFDAAPFQETLTRCNESGYDIMSVTEWKQSHEADWVKQLYDLDMKIMADVPLPDPWQDVPIDMFERELHSPGVSFDLMFVAVKDGALVGSSSIYQNLIDPTIGNTGLTGVMADHRRSGMATALKVISMLRARAQGIKTLFTDNEEKNPMLGLNIRLGFQPMLYSTEYRRILV